MKNLFEKYRSDKNFNLETVKLEDLFDELKDEIEFVISKEEHFKHEISAKFNYEYSCVNYAYGKDGDMYPSITIAIDVYLSGKYKSDYWCVLNPFEIELRKTNSVQVFKITHKELDGALIAFMTKKFGVDEYMIKREKYFKNAELLHKKREEMLFLHEKSEK